MIGSPRTACMRRADPITLTLVAAVGSLRDPTALVRFAAQVPFVREVHRRRHVYRDPSARQINLRHCRPGERHQ